jgi:hypothetical protein
MCICSAAQQTEAITLSNCTHSNHSLSNTSARLRLLLLDALLLLDCIIRNASSFFSILDVNTNDDWRTFINNICQLKDRGKNIIENASSNFIYFSFFGWVSSQHIVKAARWNCFQKKPYQSLAYSIAYFASSNKFLSSFLLCMTFTINRNESRWKKMGW